MKTFLSCEKESHSSFQSIFSLTSLWKILPFLHFLHHYSLQKVLIFLVLSIWTWVTSRFNVSSPTGTPHRPFTCTQTLSQGLCRCWLGGCTCTLNLLHTNIIASSLSTYLRCWFVFICPASPVSPSSWGQRTQTLFSAGLYSARLKLTINIFRVERPKGGVMPYK